MTKSPVKLSGKDTALVQSAGPLAFMRQQAAKRVNASSAHIEESDAKDAMDDWFAALPDDLTDLVPATDGGYGDYDEALLQKQFWAGNDAWDLVGFLGGDVHGKKYNRMKEPLPASVQRYLAENPVFVHAYPRASMDDARAALDAWFAALPDDLTDLVPATDGGYGGYDEALLQKKFWAGNDAWDLVGFLGGDVHGNRYDKMKVEFPPLVQEYKKSNPFPHMFADQPRMAGVRASKMYTGTAPFDGKAGDRVCVVKDRDAHCGETGVVARVLTDATVKRYAVDLGGRAEVIYDGYEIAQEGQQVKASKGFYGSKRNHRGFRPFYCDSEHCDTRRSDDPVGNREPVAVRSRAKQTDYTFCDDTCRNNAMCEVCGDALASEDGYGAYNGERQACDTCGDDYRTKQEDRRDRIKAQIKKLVKRDRKQGKTDASKYDYDYMYDRLYRYSDDTHDLKEGETDDEDADAGTLPEDVVRQAFGAKAAKAFDVRVAKVQASNGNTTGACKATIQPSKAGAADENCDKPDACKATVRSSKSDAADENCDKPDACKATVRSSKADPAGGKQGGASDKPDACKVTIQPSKAEPTGGKQGSASDKPDACKATVQASKTNAADDDCDGCVVCKAEASASSQAQAAAVLPSRRAPPRVASKYDSLYKKTTPTLHNKPAPTLHNKPAPADLSADIEKWKTTVTRTFQGLPPSQQAALTKIDYMERLLNPTAFDPQEQAKWLSSLDAESQDAIAAALPPASPTAPPPPRDVDRRLSKTLKAELKNLNEGLSALLQTWESRAAARGSVEDAQTQAELKQIMDLMMARPASFLPPATRFHVGDRVMFRTHGGDYRGTIRACNEYEANAQGKVCYKIERRGDGRMFYAQDDGVDLVWSPGQDTALQPSRFSFGQAWRSLIGVQEETADVPSDDDSSSDSDSDSDDDDESALTRVAPSAANTITPFFPGSDKPGPPRPEQPVYATGNPPQVRPMYTPAPVYLSAGALGAPTTFASAQPGLVSGQPAYAPVRAPEGTPLALNSGQPAYAPVRAPEGAPPGLNSGQPAGAPLALNSGQPAYAPVRAPEGAPPGLNSGQPAGAPLALNPAQPAYASVRAPEGAPLALNPAQPAYAPVRAPEGTPPGLNSGQPAGVPMYATVNPPGIAPPAFNSAQPPAPMFVMPPPQPPIFMPMPQQNYSNQPA